MNRIQIRWPSWLCGGLGLACLAGTAARCMLLEQGGVGSRVFVAAALIVLSALLLALLRGEGAGTDTLLIMLLPVGAAMLLRAMCMDYTSYDYLDFLHRWYEFFRENGGFRGFRLAVGDYNVPYLYFMAAISYLKVPDLYLIKLFSIFFDVLLAWGGLRLVRVLRGRQRKDAAPYAACALLLFLPTVILNGSYWGQCDSLYSALAVLALGQVLEGKNRSSLILLAVAFSFKLQTVFIMPLWGVLWFARKVKFRELLLFPVTYLVTIVPALLLGKPIKDILGVYLGQMGEYPRLTLNAPSVYQFIPYGAEVNDGVLSKLGIAAAAALVCCLLILGAWKGKRLHRHLAMAAAVVMVIGIPFFLPRMHERYFFLADVLAVCWAWGELRSLPVPVLVCGSSLASYCVYLRLKYNFVLHINGHFYPMGLEAAAMLVALLCAAVILIWECTKERRE